MHNAIGFGRNGGAVELRAARDDATVRIEIADDGPGFRPKAWRTRPNGSGAAMRRGRAAARGLGLAIARTMVEANAGTLQLANRAGGGALVSIVLASAVHLGFIRRR